MAIRTNISSILGRASMSTSLRWVGAASLAVASLLAVGGARAADFTLASPAYKDGDTWPSKYADNRPNAQNVNACGAGEGVSPPLAWSNPPDKTKSFALMM